MWILVTVLLVVSQASTPVARHTAENQHKASNPAKSDTRAAQSDTAPVMPPVKQELTPPKGTNARQEKQHDTDNAQRRDGFDWANVILTGLLVIVGGAGVWVGVETVQKINKQLALLDEETKATKIAADAAKDTAIATRENLELYRSKERPRIRIEVLALELKAQLSVMPLYAVHFKLILYGQTEAFVLSATASAELRDSEEGTFQFGPPMTNIPDVISPLQRIVETDCWIFPIGKTDIPTDIDEERKHLHFHGHIKYRDVFDREWVTRFHYQWKVYEKGMRRSWGQKSGYWLKVGGGNDNEVT